MTDETAAAAPSARQIGFLGCWALAVGSMIGSGVFMLPTVLAPYGLLSFGGWLLTSAGSILLVITIGRLASRTTRSGGLQVYVQDVFGRKAGFLVAWVFWIGSWLATATVSVAFVGYLGVLIPALTTHPLYQQAIALAVIWGFTLVSIRGVKDANFVQIATTLLKIAPLIAIVGLALFMGKASNLPPLNPSGKSVFSAFAMSAAVAMFAFTGFENALVPAASVKDPQRTVPRAVTVGLISVAILYIVASGAVMLLVPMNMLRDSTAPFADAARGFGAWGPAVVTIGALVSTAGFMNGNIFVTGQVAMAAAQEGIAPAFLGRLNRRGSPAAALILGSVVTSLIVVMNYSRGLVGAYTFLMLVTSLTSLFPYLMCAAAEVKVSWKSARGWALFAVVAAAYALFAIVGSGLEAVGWTVVLCLAAIPAYLLIRRGKRPAIASA